MAKILDNIQEAIFQVIALIQGNSEVRKLVYYDTPDALSQPDVSYSTPADHFTVSAIFDITEPPFDKNTLISVVLTQGIRREDVSLIGGVLKVNILTRSGLWKLDNNKIRTLELANLIIDVLDSEKVAHSNKLFFSEMELSVLDENVNGYTLNFLITDGSGFDGEF